MAVIEVVSSLIEEIEFIFKKQGIEVLQYIKSLEQNPKKGKALGTVGGIVIKELKYNNFRFYFVVDGFKLKCFNEKELVDLLIMFVRMSDKKSQQKVIDEIKEVLIKLGPSGFE